MTTLEIIVIFMSMLVTLNNGLTIITEELPSHPVASVQAWVKVGSSDEEPGEEGLAHFFEHMLFKGTATRAVGKIAEEVEAHGGDINAYTSFDQTVYHITISSRYIDIALEVLSDAILNSSFDEREIDKERLVVFEEMARSHDNPHDVSAELIFKTFYNAHPYGRPILGNRKIIENVNRIKMMEFHQKWYCPSNIVFAAAGNFNSENLIKKIESLFGHVPFKAPPQKKSYSVIERSSPSIAVQPFKTNLMHVHIAFPVPAITHQDMPLLDVSSSILGQGDSSRLFRTLKIDKKIATSINAAVYMLREPGILFVSALLPQKNLRPCLTLMRTEIEKFKQEAPHHKELEVAKTNIESEIIYEKETADGVARKLGYFISLFGSLEEEKKYYQAVSNTRANHITEMAHKYLNIDNASLACLYPEKARVSKNNFSILFQKEKSLPKKVSQPQTGPVEKRIVNGVKLLFYKNERLPLVSIRANFLGGVRFEKKNEQGISQLMTRLLPHGTLTKNRLQLAYEVEKMAGTLEGFSGMNSWGLSFDFLNQYQSEGVDLFFDVLLHPSFDKDLIEKEKIQIIEELSLREDHLATQAYHMFVKTLYKDHPYANMPIGTKKTVSKLAKTNVVNFYNHILVGDQAVITVVGDYSKTLQNEIIEYVKKIPHKKLAKLKVPKITQPSSFIQKNKLVKKEQVHIIWGFLGATLNHQDRYALHILSTLLSGQSGRLFLNLRDKKSLAYSVYASNIEGIEPGSFYVYMGTTEKKLPEALALLKEELLALSQGSLSPEEITKAKQYVIGKYEMSLQRFHSQAAFLSFDELYGIGYQETFNYVRKINDIKAYDVINCAKKYITLNHSILALAGPVHKIKT